MDYEKIIETAAYCVKIINNNGGCPPDQDCNDTQNCRNCYRDWIKHMIENSVYSITAAKIDQYLRSRGWMRDYDFPNKDLMVFINGMGDAPEKIAIPANETYGDFFAAVKRIIKTLSLLEKRKANEIIRDITKQVGEECKTETHKNTENQRNTQKCIYLGVCDICMAHSDGDLTEPCVGICDDYEEARNG